MIERLVSAELNEYRFPLREIEVPKHLWRKLLIRDEDTYLEWKRKVSLRVIDYTFFFRSIVLPALRNGHNLSTLFGPSFSNCNIGMVRSEVSAILLEALGVPIINKLDEVHGYYGISEHKTIQLIDAAKDQTDSSQRGISVNGIPVVSFFTFLNMAANKPLFVHELSRAKEYGNQSQKEELEEIMRVDPFTIWARLCRNTKSNIGLQAIAVNTSENSIREHFFKHKDELKELLTLEELEKLGETFTWF